MTFIGFPGKVGKSGKRPRFRLFTQQGWLAAALLEVDNALAAVGYEEASLHWRIRGAPFAGRSPLSLMIKGKEPAIAEVLSHLVHAGLREAEGGPAEN